MLGDRRLERRALGAVAEKLSPQPLDPLQASAIAATPSVACFSGISRPANSTSGSAGLGVTGSLAAGVEPAQDRHRAAQPLFAQALGVQLGEAERALGDERADALHGQPTRPAAPPR